MKLTGDNFSLRGKNNMQVKYLMQSNQVKNYKLINIEEESASRGGDNELNN